MRSDFARNYFFASGFQFCSSVIGAATLSSSVLMRKRPLGATSYCRPCRRVLAAADDVRGKEHHWRSRCERVSGDSDRRRHHRARWIEVIEFLAIEPPPRVDAAHRGHLPLANWLHRTAVLCAGLCPHVMSSRAVARGSNSRHSPPVGARKTRVRPIAGVLPGLAAARPASEVYRSCTRPVTGDAVLLRVTRLDPRIPRRAARSSVGQSGVARRPSTVPVNVLSGTACRGLWKLLCQPRLKLRRLWCGRLLSHDCATIARLGGRARGRITQSPLRLASAIPSAYVGTGEVRCSLAYGLLLHCDLRLFAPRGEPACPGRGLMFQ